MSWLGSSGRLPWRRATAVLGSHCPHAGLSGSLRDRSRLSLARVALTAATDRVEETARLQHELALLREEFRVKDERIERVPAPRRPHDPPVERFSLPELRAARGRSATQTTDPRFFVTEATVASWMARLDEAGPSALVRNPEPADKFPDRGKQFRARSYRRECRRAAIRQRFGAIGKHGSIALVERCIRTLEEDGVRRWLGTAHWRTVGRESALFADWFNGQRPHGGLASATPDEIYFGLRPAHHRPRFEPRAR